MTGRGNAWRPDEIAVISEMWPAGAERDALTAALPGRTYYAIQAKASGLGLKRPRWYLSVFAARHGAPPTEPRDCLTCGRTFDSEGIHNRLCQSCRRAADRSTGDDYSLSGFGAPQ